MACKQLDAHLHAPHTPNGRPNPHAQALMEKQNHNDRGWKTFQSRGFTWHRSPLHGGTVVTITKLDSVVGWAVISLPMTREPLLLTGARRVLFLQSGRAPR